jgi:plasmid stabilization system protein ParE
VKRLVIHPKVYADVSTIMEYYEQVATPELADEFYRELRAFIQKAAERPERFAIRERDLRRVNLRRFPYHFLFRIAGDAVRILVVRHHSRHPSEGTERR